MRINPLFSPGIFIAIFLGTIWVAQLTGGWIVSGRTTVDTENLAIVDIKGWMTLQQVIDGFDIPNDELYALIGVPADIPTTTALKDLESLVPGFETTTVRDALTARFGTEQASPTGVSPSSTPPTQPTMQPALDATVKTSATLLPAGQVLPASEITGKMTLREISDQCAISFETLLKGLNLPPDIDPTSQVKALVEQVLITEVAQVQTVVAAFQK